jgi:hypothetical protein
MGLALTAFGLAIVAGFVLFWIAGHIDRQLIRSHPIIRASGRVERAVYWSLNSPLPIALFLGGWLLMVVGYWITGDALSDGSPEKDP